MNKKDEALIKFVEVVRTMPEAEFEDKFIHETGDKTKEKEEQEDGSGDV